jgi:DNA-binding transcriptional MerR regulator
MPDPVFTTADVARLTGFSARQLDYWARQQWITPSIQPAHGPGSRRLYSFEDLLQLRFVCQLKSQGCSTQKIHTAVEKLRAVMEDPDPLKNAVMIYQKGMLLALCKTKAGERILLDALNASGQQVMWIVLETLTEETRQVTEARAKEYAYL